MYGWAKCLQPGRFELIDFEGFDINKFSDASLKGCIQEVNLEHLKEKYLSWFCRQAHSFDSKLTVSW